MTDEEMVETPMTPLELTAISAVTAAAIVATLRVADGREDARFEQLARDVAVRVSAFFLNSDPSEEELWEADYNVRQIFDTELRKQAFIGRLL